MPKGIYKRSEKYMKRLNLGCGRMYKDGWDNWDISENVKADRVMDVRSGDYGPSDTYDEIYCSGVLEQILTNEDFRYAINECHRILKTNGSITLILPNAKFTTAFRDPFDCRLFTEATFKYFDGTCQEWHNFGSVYGFKPWKIQSIFTNENGIITVVMQKMTNETK